MAKYNPPTSTTTVEYSKIPHWAWLRGYPAGQSEAKRKTALDMTRNSKFVRMTVGSSLVKAGRFSIELDGSLMSAERVGSRTVLQLLPKRALSDIRSVVSLVGILLSSL